MIKFLVETVTARHPTVSVEFKKISFVAIRGHMRGYIPHTYFLVHTTWNPRRLTGILQPRERKNQKRSSGDPFAFVFAVKFP